MAVTLTLRHLPVIGTGLVGGYLLQKLPDVRFPRVTVETPPPSSWGAYLPTWKTGGLAALGVAASYGAYVGVRAAYAGTRRWLFSVRVVRAAKEPESVVPHSQEVDMMPPDGQCVVAYMVRGVLEQVGCGLRVDALGRSFLLTAAHVLNANHDLYLMNGKQSVCVGKPVDFIPLAPESAALELDANLWTRIGVKIARLSPMPGSSRYVSVCGYANRGSTAKIEAQDDGSVYYNGTTMGGYSGAAYFDGRDIYGMHTHGGVRNGGYEILLLYSILKVELGGVDESDPGPIVKKLMESQYGPYVQQKGSKVIVRQNLASFNQPRRYYIFDADYWFRKEAEYEYGEESGSDYSDWVPESRPLNLDGPGIARASNALPLLTDRQHLEDLQASINGLRQQLERSRFPRQRRKRSKKQSSTAVQTAQNQESPGPSQRRRNAARARSNSVPPRR